MSTKRYGYGGDFGYGVSNFVGILDTMPTPSAAFWGGGRLRRDYTGPSILARRSTDSATLALYGVGPLGLINTSVLRTFNGWNLLRNSVFEHTGGGAPTSWSQPIATGTSAAAASTVFAGEQAWSQTATAERPYIQQTSPTLAVNTTYAQSMYVEAITGSLTANDVLRHGSLPTGAASVYPVCAANPSGGSGGVVGVGELIVQIVMSTTAGTYSVRYGVGSGGDATGTIRFSRPQLERAATRSTYEPRTDAQLGAGDSFRATYYNQASTGANLFNKSEQLTNSAWANSLGGTGAAPTLTEAAGSPPAGINAFNATRLQFSLGGGTASADLTRRIQNYTVLASTVYTFSFYAKSFDGVTSYNMHMVGATGATVVIVVTGTWQRFTVTSTSAGAGNIAFSMGLRGGQSPANSDVADVLVSAAQLELSDTATVYDYRPAFGAGVASHFVQATTTLQAIICEQGVPVTENGVLSAKFVAADARRSAIASSTAMFNELHTTGGTVASVSRSNDTAANKTLYSSSNNGTTDAGVTARRGSSEAMGVFAGRLNVAGVATNGLSVSVVHANAATSNTIVVNHLDPDNGTAGDRLFSWFNGTIGSAANAQTGTPFAENSSGNMTLGANAGGTETWDGTESTITFFPSLLTTAQRRAWEAWAGRTYGVVVA